jgi:hypothetical protein
VGVVAGVAVAEKTITMVKVALGGSSGRDDKVGVRV